MGSAAGDRSVPSVCVPSPPPPAPVLPAPRSSSGGNGRANQRGSPRQHHLRAHSPRPHQPGCVSRDGGDAAVTRGAGRFSEAHPAVGARCRGTGAWFFLPVRFVTWQNSPRSCKAAPSALGARPRSRHGLEAVNDTREWLGGRKAPGLGRL